MKGRSHPGHLGKESWKVWGRPEEVTLVLLLEKFTCKSQICHYLGKEELTGLEGGEKDR